MVQPCPTASSHAVSLLDMVLHCGLASQQSSWTASPPALVGAGSAVDPDTRAVAYGCTSVYHCSEIAEAEAAVSVNE